MIWICNFRAVCYSWGEMISDTPAKVEKILIEGFRKMPAWRKLQLLSQMTQACRQLALAGLRRRYPKAGEKELRRRLAAVLLDRDFVIKVYGWDPDKEGY